MVQMRHTPKVEYKYDYVYYIYFCLQYKHKDLTSIYNNFRYIHELYTLKTLKTFIAAVCQYNTIQCYLSTECIQNQFLFLKDSVKN